MSEVVSSKKRIYFHPRRFFLDNVAKQPDGTCYVLNAEYGELWEAYGTQEQEIERLRAALERIGNPRFVYSSDEDADEDTQLSMRMADARASLKGCSAVETQSVVSEQQSTHAWAALVADEVYKNLSVQPEEATLRDAIITAIESLSVETQPVASKRVTKQVEEGMRLRHAEVERASDKLSTASAMAYLSHLDRGELLEEVERLRNALSRSIETVKRLMTESRQDETPGELEQLRRIDKATRVYVENRTHGNYSKMCDALFSAIPPVEPTPGTVEDVMCPHGYNRLVMQADGTHCAECSPLKASGEFCNCLHGVCMGPDHTDKLCRAENGKGDV